MASLDRQERQLLRQRGAGMRNIEYGNFDLNFQFDSNREQRQLLRQRGAGHRQVEAVDFGLSFPTISAASSKQLVTPPDPSADLAAVNLSSQTEHVPQRNFSEQPQDVLEEGRVSKRRRTSTRQNSGLYFTIAEDDNEGRGGQSNEVENRPLQTAAEITPALDEENDPVHPDRPFFKLQSRSYGNVRLTQGLKDLQTPTVRHHAATSTTAPIPQNSQQQDLDHGTTTVGSQAGSAPYPATTKKRKKRRSVVLVKRRKRRSLQSNTSSMGDSTGATEDMIGSSLQDVGPDSAPYSKTRSATAMILQTIEPRKDAIGTNTLMEHSHSQRPSEHSTSEDIDDDQSYAQSDSSAAPSVCGKLDRRKTVQPKVAGRKPKTLDPGTSHVRRSRKMGFPVLTYRMSNCQRLPTINEIEEHSTKTDDLASEEGNRTAAGTTRKNPNALDVLGQICCETITALITRMSASVVGKSDSKIGKRKRSAIDAFGDHINQRCFDMSEAVENRSFLEARLRKVRRDKAELQNKWMDIRNQREQIALRCDQIRRQHWDNEAHARLQWQLSEAAQTAELQLGHRIDDSTIGLEWLLRSVSDEVGNMGQPNLLSQVQGFNVQLEAELKAFECRR